MPDITREKFIEYWGEGGYQQVFDATYNHKEDIEKILDEWKDEYGRVLEIGCGNGYWTKRFLVPRFGMVTAVDLIEKPKELLDCKNVDYVKLDCADYSLPGIKDNSIDFVWSYGTFCHFTNNAIEEYLKSIYRVMKKDRFGIIMFANWTRHVDFKDRKVVYGIDPEPFCGWTCADKDTVIRQINSSGLIYIKELIEGFTSTLAVFKKGMK